MIQWFRSGIAVKAAAVVFALLMFVFVLTSVDWGTLSMGTTVGEVDGVSIDARTYERQVQQATEARQREAPEGLGLDDTEAIRDDVWNQMVNEILLTREYDRRGIRVTEEELVDAIRNNPPPEFLQVPEFQTDSQFDLAKYQRWLGSSVAQQLLPTFEVQYRDQIERAKLFSAVSADVFLSDAALWERYRDQHESVTIDLAAIVPRRVVPDSAVSVTPGEIEAYYRSHQKELERPRTIFTSFVSVSRLPDASDTAAARARAEQVRQELLNGAPFAEVAQRESADSASAKQGGDLGEWTRGAFDPAFDSAAFKLKINAISEPVLSQFGFHIIQVTERKGNKAKGRHILIPIEVTGSHRDRLDAVADSLDRLASDRVAPAALDTAARALNLTIGQARPLAAGAKMQIGILKIPDAGVWASRAQVGQISPIIETPFAMYLFRVDSIHPAGVPPLDRIRDDVAEAVRDQKKLAQARTLAQEMVKKLEGGASLAAAAGELGLAHQEFGPFTRVSSPIRSPIVLGAAFGIAPGKHSGVIETPDGLYVLQVVKRTPADSAAFVKELDRFRAQAQAQARQERVQTYLAGLRSKADIVDRRQQLYQSAAQAGL